MNPNELLAKRAKLLAQSRAIIDKADSEKRALSAEENTQFDKLLEEANDLKDTAERMQRQLDLERDMGQSQGTVAGQRDAEGDGSGEGDPESRTQQEREEAEMRAFSRYLMVGPGGLREEESRALQMDSDESGGFTVAPQQFVNRIIQALDDRLFMRQFATKHRLASAQSLGAPSLDADPADADWSTEIKKAAEDTAMDFGKRELRPHPLKKLLKVSNKLIRTSAIGIEALVRERLTYKFEVPQEKGFLTGSGAAQPLGVFTASADGISTGRDASTGNTTTSIQFDGLIEAKYSLKGGYWRRASWIFHRDGLKQITKLKDGEGQYIWRESVRVGEPDRLLNWPVMMSEFAPNTFTTGLYVGICGDFSFYWIADSLALTIKRLDELYAENSQVGFIGELETDGMPVLEEAFARVKLA